ncbi:MAG: RDD family protein [Candidatus Hodarchaeota archaeon]
MSYNMDLINLSEYIREVSKLLPYSRSEKQPVLDDLQDDIQEALNSDPTIDILNTYGSPREVAKNISKSHDWKTKPAGWLIRTLAYFLDFVLLIIFAISSMIIGFAVVLNWLTNIINTERVELIEFIFLFSVLIIIVMLPIIIMFSYFIILERLWATTIGKWIFGLRTVDITGIKPSWKQVLIRNFTKFQGEFLPFDIIIGMMMEKEKGTPGKYQRATDILADTMVVKKL